jgi:D-inositol-3-phosphate glycosyltransferase
MTFGSLKKRIGVLMYQTSRSKGQELVAQRMVRYFNKFGHEAYLITSIYHDEKEVVSDSVLSGGGWSHVDDGDLGIPVIRVDSYVSNWPPRRILFKDAVHLLETIVNNFGLGVLITHSTLWNGPEEVAKFVEWRRNMKSLGGYQDPIVFCHMSHFQEPSPRRYSLVERSFRMAWNRISLAQIVRVANLILVVTPQEQDAKVKMGAHSDRCVLFPGGVDDDSFVEYATSSPKEFLQRFNLAPETKIVSYLGTIEERKNPMGVLDVAEKLRDRTDIHFVIAGRGDSEYADKIRNRAEKLANVTYMGEINEKEKVQLIKASYLNILMSRMEALGLAQLEFMFQGVPVITSGVGGQSWIVRNRREGIHVNGPADVEGAMRAIVELVGDRSKWQKYSANAKERASDLTFTKLMRKLDAAITEAIENETGLAELPTEVRSTLSEPEIVARTWARGTLKVVATNERLFIQRGLLSRSTLEIPYSSINSIEHVRRYRWGTLLIGAIVSFLMFTQHYLSPIISRTLTSKVVFLVTTIVPTIKLQLSQVLANLWLIPISVALLLFLTGARRGFALHGARLVPIYLPQSFSEAIRYIRELRDRDQSSKSSISNRTVQRNVE